MPFFRLEGLAVVLEMIVNAVVVVVMPIALRGRVARWVAVA